MNHETFLAQKSFGSLDGLRAVSILAVIVHHTMKPAAWIATERGFLGVDLFFAISGFLIVTLLLRERRRRSAISLRDFYARRFLRIFPLYYAVLLVLLAFSLVSSGDMAQLVRKEIGWSFAYLANWVPLTSLLSITWSLSAEEQFYLLWPPLERYAPARIVPVVIGLSVAACVAVQLGHAHLGWPAPSFLAETSFTPILLGVGLAHALDTPRGFAFIARMLGARAAPLVVLAVLCALLSWPAADISGGPRLLIHLALLALLASCVVREDHLLAPLLKTAPLVRIGALSYGLYLLHMLVRHGADKALGKVGLGGEGVALFVVTLLGTVVVAQLSFTFFEQRFLRWKDRFVR